MGRFNWGRDGPPEEAYSRVTDPERFQPLHQWALEFVADLQENYLLTMDEGKGLDPGIERVPLSRDTIKVTPQRDFSAPITIAFTDFPGLAVRFGRWDTDFFPSCGCDACDETPGEEFARFAELSSDVAAGRFRESLHLGWRGHGKSRAEFWSGGRRRSRGNLQVPRDEASRVLHGRGETVLEWEPWPLRDDGRSSR